MKKIITVILIFALMASFAACRPEEHGSEVPGTGVTEGTAQVPEDPLQDQKITVSVSGVEPDAVIAEAEATVTLGSRTLESSVTWTVAVGDALAEPEAGQVFGPGVYQAEVLYTLPGEEDIPVTVTAGELGEVRDLGDGRYCAVIYFRFHEEQAACAHSWMELPSTGTCAEGIVKHMVCTLCGEEREEPQAPGEHSFDWQNAYVEEATCGAAGKQVLTCLICGEVVEVPMEPTGEHTWEPLPPAGSCTEGLVKREVCAVCGQEREEPQEPAEHIWEELPHTGSCTEGLVRHEVCTVCGLTQDHPEEPTEHSFDWENAKVEQAVCDRPGKRTATCLVCGATATEEIEATGEHSWRELPHTGSCTEGLVKHEVCTVCGRTRDTQQEPGEHSPDWSGAEVEEATCAAPGKRTGTCLVCGATVEEIIPATGDHNYKVDIHGGNCVTGLDVEYICTACGHSYEDVLYSEHSWGKAEYWNDRTHRCICIFCNAVEYFNHVTDETGHCGGCGTHIGN